MFCNIPKVLLNVMTIGIVVDWNWNWSHQWHIDHIDHINGIFVCLAWLFSNRIFWYSFSFSSVCLYTI